MNTGNGLTRKVHPLRPDPENAEILDGFQRATDAERDVLVQHLHTLHAQGALPVELHRIRVEDAEQAETTYDLQRLIADLPALPAPKESLAHALRYPFSWLRANWDKTGVILAVHVAVIVLGIALAGVSAFFRDWGLPTGFAVPFILSGIVIAVASLIYGIVRATDAYTRAKKEQRS